MQVKAGLLIDFGNSETRVYLVEGGKSTLMTLTNKYAELPPGYKVGPSYRNDKTTIFQYNGSYYAHGLLVDREFVGFELRPSSVQNKVDQLVTQLTIQRVIFEALKHLSKEHNVPIQNIKVTFNVSVLLPPIEHEVNEQKMIDLIKMINQVKVLLPVEGVFDFKIEDIKVYPEGVAAFFGACFKEENGEIVAIEENEVFQSGYVMVLDIGAGTTDIVLIRDSELVSNSRETVKKGGNTVISFVNAELKKQFGFVPSNITKVIEEGILEEGVKTHYVEDILNEAKNKYSKALMENIRQYLERMMLDMPEIKGILVVGGGSLPAIRDNEIVSPSMADVLIKYFKVLAPNITTVSTMGKNPRNMNIEGLKLIYKYA